MKDYQTELFGTPQPSFHNTVDLKGEELRKKEKSAKSLEARVQRIFDNHPHCGYTRAELVLIFGQQYPEVSFGRALTNLANDPSTKIYKSEEMRKGLHGVFNFVYKKRI